MARGIENGYHDDGDDDENLDQMEEVARREGSIVKIRMKDFITYDSVECFPGDSLNVVIGPNGTGKSTILSAIVLGLGGKPTLLGKPQAQIQDFIKNQRQEAEIEIELLRRKKNTVIKRTIFKSGKSIWHLNGRQVNAKDIDAETKALNIQVDNLCQVLAQDRVQDFAKLNKQELLAETQKAIGKEAMADIHANLKALQREQKNLEIQIEAEKKKRDLEQSHVDRLQGVVEKISKRRDIENEADVCKLKLSILQYQSKNDEAKRYKEMKKNAETEVKKIDAQIEPFKKKIDEAEEKFRNTKNRQSGMDKRIRLQMKKVSDLRNDLENVRDDILDLEVEKDKQLKHTETQQLQEEEAKQSISKLRNDIVAQEQMSVQDIVSRVNKLKAEMAKLHEQINKNEGKKNTIGYEMEEIRGELRDVNRELDRVENQRGLRLRALQEINPNAAQAVEWVEANKHLFNKPVYLPMLVELDVNPQFARYVETAIGYSDLIAFVCESAEDTKIIVDNCRKRMGLKVNVLQSDAAVGPPPEPPVSLDDLRGQYPGFEGYLIDFVKGPNTLLHFLCRRKNFNSIPVSRGDVVADSLQRYYSGDYSKGYTKSRFGSGLMYSSDPIPTARYFKQSISDVDEAALRKRADELKNKIAAKESERAQKQDEISNLNSQRKTIRDETNKLETSQTTLQTLKFQLGRKEKDLEVLMKRRVDPDAIREQFAQRMRDAVLKLANKQEPFFQSLKDLDNLVIESQTLEFEVQNAKALKESSHRLCSAEQDALEAAKRNLEAISTAHADRRKEATDCLTAITRAHKKNILQLWEENENVFAALPNTIEDLETHIEDKLAHAQMLGGGNDANQLHEFEQHVKQLDALTKSIATKENQARNVVENMDTRESEWKRELNELVDTISANFSRYFAEMNCAGEVVLFTGNNEHDYDNYGLRVRVKFRNSEALQDLNAHTQSGGERAVSTAIYMLALQELTPAPFRLVDEINQGMDAINERRVYELLLRSTSRPGTPQYFLLTPKLLRDMEYNAGTTVLCVMNSACAPNHKTWDIQRFIKLRKQENSL